MPPLEDFLTRFDAVIPTSERAIAAAPVTYTRPRLGETLERHFATLGLDPLGDVSRTEHLVAGNIVVTDRRVLVAKESRWRGTVKPEHVILEAPADRCRLLWWDVESGRLGKGRSFRLVVDDGRFASGIMPLAWPLGRGKPADPDVLAEAVVFAFGPRGTRIQGPDGS
jgi:hypothetical protein